MKDRLLELLEENAMMPPERLAAALEITIDEVKERIAAYEEEGIILGYRAVINEDKLDLQHVKAVIEVRVQPEREGGFDRVAHRISRFPEVSSVFLMSGGYDLLLVIEGRTLREVATFVAETLATMPGVNSTATHFMLRTYKEQGVLMLDKDQGERLPVSP
jgi:DNA-binding Lrp family transcriptional regulator